MAKTKCNNCKGDGWLRNEHGQWSAPCQKCKGVGLVEESFWGSLEVGCYGE